MLNRSESWQIDLELKKTKQIERMGYLVGTANYFKGL